MPGFIWKRWLLPVSYTHLIVAKAVNMAEMMKVPMLGIDGTLGQHGQAVLCSHLIHMALAEHIDVLAAVGADDVAHGLDFCFSRCTGLSGESPYTMHGETKVHLYERERYPDYYPTPPMTAMASRIQFHQRFFLHRVI